MQTTDPPRRHHALIAMKLRLLDMTPHDFYRKHAQQDTPLTGPPLMTVVTPTCGETGTGT